MTFRIDLTGDKEFKRAVKSMRDENRGELTKLLVRMAFKTQSLAVSSIQKKSISGRTYKRGNIIHVASAPGSPPNTDTGNLVKNITIERENDLSYNVGSRKGAPYGLYLEFGTRNIKARPWLSPAVDEVLRKFRGEFD